MTTHEDINNFGLSPNRNEEIKALYTSSFPMVLSFVYKNGGTMVDARDHMQDCIYELILNIRSGKFQGRAKMSTYFFSIVKFKWYRRHRDLIKEQEAKTVLERYEESSYELDEVEIDPDVDKIINAEIGRLSEACQVLVRDFYLHRKSFKDIAKKLGISAASARVKRIRCISRLRKNILENPLYKK